MADAVTIASASPPGLVRVTMALALAAACVADALNIAWDTFQDAAGDDLAGWEVTAAAAEVQPGPPLIATDDRRARKDSRAGRAGTRARGHEIVVHFHVAGGGQHVAALLGP